MAAKITRLPQPASHTIEQVFDEFLGDQRRRLRPRTLSTYEDVLGLLRDHLNGYAYQSLSTVEAALFDRYYNAPGDKHLEFCQLFGPDKIVANLGGFLGYFMIRKVVAGQDLKRAAGTVTKKLSTWLAHRVTSPRTKLKRGRISARRPPGICPRPSGRPGFCTTPRLTSPLARTTWATTFWNSIAAPSPRLKREDSGSRALREGHGVPTVLSSFQPPRRSCSAKDGTSAAPSAAWMGHGGSSKWRTSTPCRICFLSPSLRGLRTSHPAGGSRPSAAPPQAQAHDHLSVTR